MTDPQTAVAVLQAELAALRREFMQAVESSAQSVAKAEIALDRRLDHANEFRAQLTEQAATFATREQVAALDPKFQSLYDRNYERINDVSRRLDVVTSERLGSRRTITAMYAAIGVAVAVIGLMVVLANVLTGQG